jgi:hypothetical protein
MAILKKGSRKIIVDSTSYRWNIRRKPTHRQGDYSSCVTAAVELLENPGATLSIEFFWNQYNNYDGTQFPVTPKDIELSIREALSKGWQPEKPGSTFHCTTDTRYDTQSA